MTYKYSLIELQKKAEDLADSISCPQLILLNGNLGVGKTTFAQFFIRKIVGDIVVTSPTFNIVQVYESIKGPIWHVDLYRVKNTHELEELGLLEAIHQNICIVEWPELLETYVKLKQVYTIYL